MSTLLADERVAREFCRAVLMPYGKPRILELVARKKYSNGELDTGTLILERSVLHFDKGDQSEESFIRELRKFQALSDAGLYSNSKTKQRTIVKPDWMVVYVTAYPLDEDDASDAFLEKVLETRKEQRRALARTRNRNVTDSTPSMSHVIGKMKACLHSHPCKQWRLLKLDVDTKDRELIHRLQQSMQGAAIVFAAETRGGYHVLFEKGPCCKRLYEFVQQAKDGVDKEEDWILIETQSGPMVAIPGTNQGGFTVRTVTESWRRSVEAR